MPAATCLELGMVNQVVAHQDLSQATLALAAQLLQQAPLSLRYSKEAIRRSADLSLAEAIDMEAALQKLLYDTEDFAEGKAAFKEKRKPQWKGR